MTPEMIAKLKVIGSRVTMRTTSWDEGIKLIDGILYDIDFHQDFSAISLNGKPMTDMPIDSIIELINNFEAGNKICVFESNVVPSAEEYRRSREFWEWFENYNKKERKREEKWKKDRKKRIKRFKQTLNDMDSGLYFVKW